MAKQLIRIGNSIGLTLPTSEVSRLKLKPGDKVEIYTDGQSLKLVPVRRIKPVKLGGLWRGTDISEEDISKIRREMWGARFK